jgi:MEDS: MEthanogen/methylotroph, DcmR Sensory domain
VTRTARRRHARHAADRSLGRCLANSRSGTSVPFVSHSRQTKRGVRTRTQHVRRPDRVSEHILQLFDTDESLVETVSRFLAEGASLNQTLLIVSTPAHWKAIAARMRTYGVDVDGSIGQRSVTVMDAEDLLARFMRRGEPKRALFHDTVGALVRRLSPRAPAGLRIYGEMVELLAGEGNYSAAAELEALWNELAQRYSFTLLCGYSAAHFAAPDAGSALAAICSEHSLAVPPHASTDPLGHFLLSARNR